jgi:hypothetical protein
VATPLIAAVLALATPAIALAATPVQRSFGDWTVTCDNGLRCVALGGEDDGGRVLVLDRNAGADGAILIELRGADANLVDGTAVRYPEPQWMHEVIEENLFEVRSSTDLEAVQAFIDAIRNGSRLHAADDGEDKAISLRGLSAALLFIDEAQGRLGTPGALLRRGGKAETTVPAAPPLPVLRAAPATRPLSDADAPRLAAGVRRFHADALAKAECDEEQGPNADQAWALTDREALVYVGCWMGAYQGSGLLFRTDRDEPSKSARLLLPSVPGEPAMEMLTSAEYDPATAQLHHYAKGRGLGDCGEIVSWVFDGRAFVLAEYTSMQRCAGVDVDAWPTLWRSRTASKEAAP